MKRLSVLLAGIFLFLPPIWAGEPGDAILGKWHTTDDKSLVEVFKDKDRFCAKIVSLKEPNWPANDEEGMGGKPKNDRRNPDPRLRSRPIAGIQFMSGFVYAGKKVWDGGTIYDPESGKTYKCKMSLISTNQLEVHGYVGISLLGRTVDWKREAKSVAASNQSH
jgi:uncharacterized protein (DUF2147 family)